MAQLRAPAAARQPDLDYLATLEREKGLDALLAKHRVDGLISGFGPAGPKNSGRSDLLALQTDNLVASFLITYAAIAVFTGGGQKAVDSALAKADPSVRMLQPTPSGGRFGNLETEFTSARNDFIHAEDRGRDPVGAKARLEAMIVPFRALVGRILS